MVTTRQVKIEDLALDLRNFRTVPQNSEINALHAMISIAPDGFWALAESLLDSGYLPTENIIVLEVSKGKLEVREGNRRIGALKVILGLLKDPGLSIPPAVSEKIKKLTANWKKTNGDVPCAIYDSSDEQLVDKIVTLAHGKGEKAGRDNWTSVARARHNRDKGKASEPGLDLLEKYLQSGKNLTQSDKDIWAGIYPLTVLDEVIGKVAPRIGLATSRDLADQYPANKYRNEIENILKDIGNEVLTFEVVRNKFGDFAVAYGIPAPASKTGTTTGSGTSTSTGSGTSTATGRTTGTGGATSTKKSKAVSANDPRSVRRTLKHFAPRGKGRNKLVTLLEEARTLNLETHPHSFCFLLRAMFELSTKAFSADHSISMMDSKGKEKSLATLLTDITGHLTKGKPRTDPFCHELHGAMTELGKKNGLLSLTSMNQLIHNANFVTDARHICVSFTNTFPLLSAMNR
jgi:hypothetical protein